jgi:hypothetical protein
MSLKEVLMTQSGYLVEQGLAGSEETLYFCNTLELKIDHFNCNQLTINQL